MAIWVTNMRVMYHQRRIQDLAGVIKVLKEMKHLEGTHDVRDEDILFFTGKMMAHLEKIRDLKGAKAARAAPTAPEAPKLRFEQ
jgi:hypothetical protein